MTIDKEKLRRLATVFIECQPEDISIEGNAMASGNDAEDKKVEDEIKAQLESGNDWAWCCVKVTAKFAGLEGADYLGACSYNNIADFKAGGYYEDMIDRALDELIKELEAVDVELPKIKSEVK